MTSATGCVYLVGAGPGDPELLTVKALRLLGAADVIVYDRLVSVEILALLPDGVMRIFAGKANGNHTLDQAEINQLLVRVSASGRQVVRLKGGDPFIFGRGSEEAQYLASHGVPFEVVPGVTAASACASYAGIPLTHRGLAHAVQFVTGHCRDDKPPVLDWEALAKPDGTLVIYMGLAHLDEIIRNLVKAGLPGTTPAALVEQGTTPRQRCLVSDLECLAAQAVAGDYRAPATVIVGRVVSLAQTLSWFVPRQCEHADAPRQRVHRYA